MKLHLEGLRRRVVKYYFIMIIITVALFEVLFMFYMKEYYYSMAKSYLEQQVRYTQSSYDSTAMDSTSFQDKINNILEKESLSQDSSYKEVNNDFAVAIEIINKNKEIILDQYGIKTNEVVNYEDVNKALAGNEDYSFSISSIIETKDHIMSVSVPLKVNNVVEGVVRYSVSLNKADFKSFIHDIIYKRFSFMSENYKVAHILLAEVLYREELRIQIVESLKSTVFDNFDIILNYFKSENMIKNISNELIIRTILTNICGYVMLKYIFNPNGNYDDDKELKYIEELIVNAFSL